MARRAVSVTEVLDSSPFTSYQALVGILCFCCTLLDGFNLTVIGVAVPKIAEYLRVTPPALGVAMSAGQLGPLIGAAVLGMLADRVGRRRMLVACAFTFGLFTLLCAFITSASDWPFSASSPALAWVALCRPPLPSAPSTRRPDPVLPSPPRCMQAFPPGPR